MQLPMCLLIGKTLFYFFGGKIELFLEVESRTAEFRAKDSIQFEYRFGYTLSILLII